ncbi:uncharacterized protein EV420DRAFT_1771739 [Desarmillaria tabescens]|uniref:F-box domain-containing protein n=1 Tax=Armillaria tabescens TaxID=1929756 RepID=A0AA39J0G1_ARMTA|nr:uncharacterized protein EV420DRAFT_1771739 [Desarmillaria tabescens]KAK0432972.1 hypothetical protein EV420DRAFT_1771739 [Desarmillaria tabescens]
MSCLSCLTCRNCGFVNIIPLQPQLQNTTAIQSSDSFVSQILRGLRPLLDSEYTLFNAEIVKLKRLRSLYDTQLQEIELHRHTVLKALESRKSIFAPIRRLPQDLLIQIFHSVSDSWWQETRGNYHLKQERHSLDVSGPLWVLGRVCGLWRDILHTLPALWAQNVVVKYPFSKHAHKILQAHLEYSGEQPLTIQATFSGRHELTRGEAIMSLLVQSCNRWKNVRIRIVPHHAHHLESIANLPVLQTFGLDFIQDYRSRYCLDICLKAPQLWQASLPSRGIHQLRIPSRITQYSGCITCAEDLRLLAGLPNLETCHLLPWRASVVHISTPAVVAKLRYLYVNDPDSLDFLTAPLLQSLTISQIPLGGSLTPVTSFFRRSGCHLESLSLSMCMQTCLLNDPDLNDMINMLSSEACSTISRLKIELGKYMHRVTKILTHHSSLPNLRHLILCNVTNIKNEAWNSIPKMIRSRRDAGLVKIVELRFADDKYEASNAKYATTADIRGLTGDNLEMRVEELNPPSEEHLLIFDHVIFFE